MIKLDGYGKEAKDAFLALRVRCMEAPKEKHEKIIREWLDNMPSSAYLKRARKFSWAVRELKKLVSIDAATINLN